MKSLRYRKSGAGQPENRRELVRHSEQHKQNHGQAQSLYRKTNDSAQGMQTGALHRQSNEEMIHQSIAQIDCKQHQQNQHRGLQHGVLNRTLADLDHIEPVAVSGGQIVLVLDALVEIAEIFLIH